MATDGAQMDTDEEGKRKQEPQTFHPAFLIGVHLRSSVANSHLVFPRAFEATLSPIGRRIISFFPKISLAISAAAGGSGIL
jgi:hypothetical protein